MTYILGCSARKKRAADRNVYKYGEGAAAAFAAAMRQEPLMQSRLCRKCVKGGV
jgi:hypothetical protein